MSQLFLRQDERSDAHDLAKGALPELYRDEYLIAVHKPSGLLVHRTGIDRHESDFALQRVRAQSGRRVFPVHRLDKATSGVLLFAFSPDLAGRIGAQFEDGRVAKSYLAVVRGHPDEAGVVDHPLMPVRDAYAAASLTASSQPALTRYRRLATCELPFRVDRYPTSRYALVLLNPVTGRRHQLRRHMKHIAHPIIGDANYGKGRHNRKFQAYFGCARLLLACTEMCLEHPATGAALKLAAPLQGCFAQVVIDLGWSEAMRTAVSSPFRTGLDSANMGAFLS